MKNPRYLLRHYYYFLAFAIALWAGCGGNLSNNCPMPTGISVSASVSAPSSVKYDYTWSAVAEAHHYQVEMQQMGTVVGSGTTTVPSYSLTLPYAGLNSGEYSCSFRVRSVCDAKGSSVSDTNAYNFTAVISLEGDSIAIADVDIK